MKPTVCVVMLVNGRPDMTRRAIASFRAQTYEYKRLLIWDSGVKPALELAQIAEDLLYFREECSPTIGELRNRANSQAASGESCAVPDLIAHFDSDDWSHPRRLEEQVGLLEASGKACVGYREMLFWDTRVAHIEVDPTRKGPDGKGCLGTVKSIGEAWIYRNPGCGLCAGGTIMYRRELWEQCPFPDAPHEDRRWWSDNQAVSAGYLDASAMDGVEPRFVAHLHGGNTETIGRKGMLSGGGVWWRAQQFDAYCQERMQL